MLTFLYDGEADILYINTVDPYTEQSSEELGNEVVARFNPTTGLIENLEILSFSARLSQNEVISLPLVAELRLSEHEPAEDTTYAMIQEEVDAVRRERAERRRAASGN